MLFHGIYDVFAIGSKNHCIYSIFEPHLAKALVFTQSSSCCKKYFPPHNGVGFLFLILNPSRPPPPPPPHLSHTSLSHTISHASTLSHTIFHTQLCHTHTIFHTQLCHTHHLSHTSLSHAISHAGVALGDLHLRFAWHLATSTFVSRDRRGTYGTRLALVVCWWLLGRAVTPRHFPWQAALGDIYRRFAWQAWRLATTTVVLRGRRLTYGTGLALVARLGPPGRAVTPRHFAWQAALGDIYRRFVWQAWHLATSTVVLRGRWHLWHWAGSGGTLGALWSRGDAAALCVAGVALGNIYRPFCAAGILFASSS